MPTVGPQEGLFLDPAGAPRDLVPVSSPVTADISNNHYGFADDDYDRVIARSVLARVEHDFTPDPRASNQTKIADTRRDSTLGFIQNAAAYNPATGEVTIRRARTQTDNQILSKQTNLTTSFETGPLAHDLSIGLDISRETQFSPLYTAGNSGTADTLAPDAHRDPSDIPTYEANSPYSKARIDSAGLYAFETLHLNEKLMLNLGGRLERFNIDYTSLPADTTAPFDLVPDHHFGPDSLFIYKTGVVFKPAAAGSANDPATEPQEAHSYEIGVKWDFMDKRLSTSLAFFRSINENVATNIAASGSPCALHLRHRTARRRRRVRRLRPHHLRVARVWRHRLHRDRDLLAPIRRHQRRQPALPPKLSANLWTTYALFRRFTIGGGAQYIENVTRSTDSEVRGSATNPADTYLILEIPSYWVFSALAEYAVSERVSLRLNVNNLFDEDYYRINNNGGRYYPSASRGYVLSTDFKF